MKRYIFLAVCLVFCVSIKAQDKLLKQIRTQNATVKSFISDVSDTCEKKEKQSINTGKLYYIADDKFSAYFENDEYMVINENRMKIDMGLLHGKFRLNNNGLMRSFSQVFLYGFQGRCEDLAVENDYSINVQEHNDHIKVFFTKNKKVLIGLGLKTIVFKYELNGLLLKEITIIDFSGTRHTFCISNTNYNVMVGAEKFNL